MLRLCAHKLASQPLTSSGTFTRQMGMLVDKDNLGFGMRSWRYAMIIDNGFIETFLPEEGFSDNCPEDPYGESSPQNVLDILMENNP